MAQDWDQPLTYNEESGISSMAHTIIQAHIEVDSTVASVKAITETMIVDFREGSYEWLIGQTYKGHDGAMTWSPEWGGWTDVKGSEEFLVESEELLTLQEWEAWESDPKNCIPLKDLAVAVAKEIIRILP